MEKSYLYKTIFDLIKKPDIEISALKSSLNQILKKLIKGKKVQETSC
jgi:hypothetical protein